MDFQTLVDQFAEAVTAQHKALWERADHKTANKFAKRYLAIFMRLREHGDEGRDALAVLLNHLRPEVRVATAAFLLRHRTEAAQAVLRAAARRPGVIGFQASEALKRWEEGVWALDPA